MSPRWAQRRGCRASWGLRVGRVGRHSGWAGGQHLADPAGCEGGALTLQGQMLQTPRLLCEPCQPPLQLLDHFLLPPRPLDLVPALMRPSPEPPNA